MATNLTPDARKRQIMIWYVLAAVVGVLLFQAFWASYSQVETIPYSEFETLLDQSKVADVTVSVDSVQGTLKEPLPSGKREFFSVRVDPQLADKLASHQVVVNGAPSGGIIQTILSWVIPAVIFYGIWVFLFRHVAEKQGFGGLMTVGKSRAKVSVETDTKVTFEDVAGVDEAKFELQELVAFLRDPKSYGRLGARVAVRRRYTPVRLMKRSDNSKGRQLWLEIDLAHHEKPMRYSQREIQKENCSDA